ncbi:MAG: Bax inhibitor-1/YccA family protein [Phycisphaeraceae bacterium]|nr:Bax inhibitor-1/YccA family protein [Phycisphaeraceae bacterium]
MNASNPMLRQSVFEKPVNAPRWDELGAAAKPGTMTVQGTAIKAGFFLAVCVMTAIFSWMKFEPMYQAGNIGGIVPWLMGSSIGGFVLAMIVSFKPRSAAILGPVYAALQGVVIASLSLLIVAQMAGSKAAQGSGQAVLNTGLIFQAASMTFGIAAAALLAYATGIIRLSPMAMKIISVAIGGIAIYAIGLMLLNGIFNMGLPNLWVSNSPIGIGFSLLVVGLASFTLVMNYQMIDEGAKSGQPKYMEWYSAFALTVTLVWLYIEILRLLSKLNRRD